jgi:small subunit ribosomal protein S6e
MKLNISNPTTGQNLPLVVDDEHKLSAFMGKRIGTEVSADSLGDNWKNYILKITGGHDKDGFTMKQGILMAGRTRILMSEGHATYRTRRSGERKKKSVRGCIVGHDISALALSIVKQGEGQIEGLTNEKKPRRRGPKRATRIRKLFALQKKDDPRRYVLLYSRKIEKGGKNHWKTPRIQRLVTDTRLRRKRLFKADKVEGWKKTKVAKVEYLALIEKLKKKKAHAAGLKHSAEKAAKNLASGKPATTTTTTAKTATKAGTKVDPKATAGKTTATTAKTGKDAGKTVAPTKGTTPAAPTKGTQPAGKTQPTTTVKDAPKTTTTTKKTGK